MIYITYKLCIVIVDHAMPQHNWVWWNSQNWLHISVSSSSLPPPSESFQNAIFHMLEIKTVIIIKGTVLWITHQGHLFPSNYSLHWLTFPFPPISYPLLISGVTYYTPKFFKMKFLIFDMSGIIWYLSFFVWLVQLNIVIFMSIHVTANDSFIPVIAE